MSTLELHSDGACKSNPGPGGWGICGLFNGQVVEMSGLKGLYGGEKHTTNNRMEMRSFLEGLHYSRKVLEVLGSDITKIEFRSDSNLVVKGVNEWMKGWESRGWKKAGNKKLENADLWKPIYQHWHETIAYFKSKGVPVSVTWVKGHSGHPGNEMADELANAGVKRSNHEMSFFTECLDLKPEHLSTLLAGSASKPMLSTSESLPLNMTDLIVKMPLKLSVPSQAGIYIVQAKNAIPTLAKLSEQDLQNYADSTDVRFSDRIVLIHE